MPTPALRVTVGGSADSMQGVPVNYDQEPIDLKTSHFEGRITGVICSTVLNENIKVLTWFLLC